MFLDFRSLQAWTYTSRATQLATTLGSFPKVEKHIVKNTGLLLFCNVFHQQVTSISYILYFKIFHLNLLMLFSFLYRITISYMKLTRDEVDAGNDS